MPLGSISPHEVYVAALGEGYGRFMPTKLKYQPFDPRILETIENVIIPMVVAELKIVFIDMALAESRRQVPKEEWTKYIYGNLSDYCPGDNSLRLGVYKNRWVRAAVFFHEIGHCLQEKRRHDPNNYYDRVFEDPFSELEAWSLGLRYAADKGVVIPQEILFAEFSRHMTKIHELARDADPKLLKSYR